jgi:hypothetical protein
MLAVLAEEANLLAAVDLRLAHGLSPEEAEWIERMFVCLAMAAEFGGRARSALASLSDIAATTAGAGSRPASDGTQQREVSTVAADLKTRLGDRATWPARAPATKRRCRSTGRSTSGSARRMR